MDRVWKIALLAAPVALLSSCQFEKSGATGWNYNDSKNGGFEKAPFEDQENGPGLILVEGGQFTMGRVSDDLAWASERSCVAAGPCLGRLTRGQVVESDACTSAYCCAAGRYVMVNRAWRSAT